MLLKRISFSVFRLSATLSHTKFPTVSLNISKNPVFLSMLTFDQHKFFSNTAEKQQENSFEERTPIIESQENSHKAISLNNPPKKKSGAHILYYGKILMRVSKTCQIYLDSPDAKRGIVDENSRFYYVKRKLDALNDQEKARFRQYLNQINERFSKRGGQHTLQSGQEKINLEDKKPKFRLRKQDALAILNEPENGPLLRSLILEFLDPQNRDFELYLKTEEDEVAIGEVTKQKKPEKLSLINLLANELDVIKFRFKATREISQQESDKKVRFTHANNYGYIIFRVVKTCQIYLDAPEDKKAQVEPNSRFYYVKEKLDVLSPEERNSFEVYLNQRDYYFYGHYSVQSGANKEKDNMNIKAEESSPSKYEYTLRRTQFTKKGAVKYLEEPNNGPLLKSLILEFLKQDNVDRALYVDSEKDEVDIGKVVSEKKSKKKKFMTFLLEDDLELTRKRFENYNEKYVAK